MADGLGSMGLIPTLEANAASGMSLSGFGGESVSTSMLGTLPGDNNVVDWIQIRLSTAANPEVPVALRNVLVRRNGSAMELDGSDLININGLAPGSYHLTVQHRNHLGAMTSSPIMLSGVPATVDFTNPTTTTFGTDAQQNINGAMALWSGDGNGNGTIQYTGLNNDRDPVLVAIGGSVATNTVTNVYSPLDINMNGTISYTGLGNDRDVILQTIGGSVASAVRVEQLP